MKIFNVACTSCLISFNTTIKANSLEEAFSSVKEKLKEDRLLMKYSNKKWIIKITFSSFQGIDSDIQIPYEWWKKELLALFN